MNNRIALVLKAKNISSAQLADDLGVQRSGISHILNGRNKPSLEFVQKLIKRYPDISMNWILFGEGQMMNPYPSQPDESTITNEPLELDEKPKPRMMELFAAEDEDEEVQPTHREELPIDNTSQPTEIQQDKLTKQESVPAPGKIETEEKSHPGKDEAEPGPQSMKSKPSVVAEPHEIKKPDQPVKAVRKINKILVFYSDQTFVEYRPGEEE